MFLKVSVALLALTPTALIGPNGALPGSSGPKTYTVPLTGQAQVDDRHPFGGTGDMDGSGTVKLTIDPARKQICYRFELADVATSLMAHIHKGPALHNGPTVVTLFTDPGGNLGDCVVWTKKWLDEIVSNAANFYVSLYTTEYPDGALRGQLQAASF